jgi:hypothetical protein
MHVKQILILLIPVLTIKAGYVPERLYVQFKSAYYKTETLYTGQESYFKKSRFQSGPFGEISIRLNHSMQAGLAFHHIFKSDIYDYGLFRLSQRIS